eukprot:CAMPEP_0183357162 /NCGR_PEP_ID=MMETSP0164_2-20130417/45517_1 /TAXON_ID=221442 /ORGANISM="Coccolithus pelagicus ssp braarudi, Strain PLY182g" /LENGTH=134 /DNA_ID=CAMNT_0025530727 /DNA_START=47 /DNA_END=451 /DNA_ORIENTATION=-
MHAKPALRTVGLTMIQWPWESKAPVSPTKTRKYSEEELTKLAFSNPASLTAEEMRLVKLELGTNWRPRTSTTPGEGYTFFQSPSPKTGVQTDLPDFFSSENLANAGKDLGTVPKVLLPLFGVTFLLLAGTLVLS